MNSITLDEFTGNYSSVFDLVKRTGAPILITDRGMILAEIHPPSMQEKKERKLGEMRDTIEIIGDIISPVSDENNFVHDIYRDAEKDLSI